MTPYFDEDGITIYHGDCREILPTLPNVDLVLTDPPYGIDWVPRVNHRGDDRLWIDDRQFDPRPFIEDGRLHAFFGAQYFAHLLPPSESWLAWVKRPVDFDFSDDTRTYSTTELAWTDFGCKARFFAHVWDGGMRSGEKENRWFCHPSQKPIELMRWCIERAGDLAQSILDPFMGSGTTLVAARDMGRKAIGIEIEEKYCEIAANRLAQKVLF